MWEIYSVGDAAFMERILNALAMLAGTGNLEQVAAIGMVVGVVILGFQSIVQGGTGIRFQNLLVSWVIFMVLFGGGARVAVEDVYSGQVRIVDNVPQGVAAAGSMVSKLGYGITELFEQAFGEVQMTDTGFAFALETLANLRKVTLNKAGLGSANSPTPGDDVWQSWNNYVADCTMVGVEQGEYSIEQINTASRSGTGNILAQLRFDSMAYGTKIEIAGAPYSGFMTCTDAYNTLYSYTHSTFRPALERKLSEIYGIQAAHVPDRIQSAFEALENSSIDSQNYMLATAMAPIFEWGLVNNEINFQRQASASMLHTAIQQRNDMWAAEQALFNTVVRPMMTFFEGLVYAIAPMMAFLVGLGPAGISLIAKYLMIMIWIQLWMPVLAIVNLYLHMSVSRKMVALQDHSAGNTPLDSFYGIYSLDQTLQTWVSTGGMLAASVPAITLMLIYGSAVTATSLAGRMSTGNVAAEASSPALTSNSAVFDRGAMTGSTQARGLNTADSERMRMEVQGGYSSTLASSSDEVHQNQQKFAESLGNQLTSLYGNTQGAMQAVGSTFTESAQNSEAYQQSLGFGRQLLQGTSFASGMSDQDIASFGAKSALSMSGGARASAGAGGLQNSAGVNAAGGASLEATKSTLRSIGVSGELSASDSEQLQANLGSSASSASGIVTALAKDVRNQSQDSFTHQLSAGNSTSLTKEASDVVSSSERFQAMQQMQQTMGVASSHDDQSLPGTLRNMGLDGNVRDFVNQYGDTGLHQKVNEKYDALEAINPNARHEDRELAAMTLAIADGSYLEGISDEGQREQAAIAGANLLGRITGQSTPSQTGAGDNRGISQNVAGDNTGLRERVDKGTPGAGVTQDQIINDNHAGRSATGSAIDNTDTRAFYEEGKGNLTEVGEGFENQYDDFRVGRAGEVLDKVISQNDRSRDTLTGSDSRFTQGNWDQQTLLGMIRGDNGVRQMLERNGVETGLPGRNLVDMSPAEREAEGQRVQSIIANDLVNNYGMDRDAAEYAGGMLAGSGLSEIYSYMGSSLNGHMRGAGVSGRLQSLETTQEQVDAAAIDATHNLATPAQERLESRLMESNGGNQEYANTAIEDLNKTVSVLGAVKGVGTQEKAVEMTDRLLAQTNLDRPQMPNPAIDR
ncbi:MAG: conjugal transfer protein TraG [Halomonadaceae bacterium]|nr:conjugal transfer protein TraG [Halomonadaceae bacterium]